MAAKARFGDLAQVALRLGFGGSEAAGKVEGTFVFAGTIGVGGFGHAGLWVEHDVNGNIVKVSVERVQSRCRRSQLTIKNREWW